MYGAGSLGSCAVAILTALYPDVEVAVVARFDAQAQLAERLGAAKVLAPEPRLALIEELVAWGGGRLRQPLQGLPMAIPVRSTSSTTRSASPRRSRWGFVC